MIIQVILIKTKSAMQPSVSILKFLDEPYPLTAEQVSFYQKNRYIKLKQVLNEETLDFFNNAITVRVNQMKAIDTPLEQRSTYGKAFLQLFNLWCEDEVVKKLIFSKRLGKIASDLMQTDGVRIYHDQALFKEGGGGITPWHADQYYWPLNTDKTITAWIPLQETPLQWGPLEFSAGSFKLTQGRDKEISDESQDFLESVLKKSGFEHVIEAFDLGEVSFHKGWLYHRAGPNLSTQMRKVMTVIYMDKDIKLKQPENKNQQADWDTWCPNAKIGEVINTPLNPIIYQ